MANSGSRRRCQPHTQCSGYSSGNRKVPDLLKTTTKRRLRRATHMVQYVSTKGSYEGTVERRDFLVHMLDPAALARAQRACASWRPTGH